MTPNGFFSTFLLAPKACLKFLFVHYGKNKTFGWGPGPDTPTNYQSAPGLKDSGAFFHY
jgi:hypothetical protein